MRAESLRPPLTLEGRYVRLVPLAFEHRHALVRAAQDPEIHRYILNAPGRTLEEMDRLIALLLARQAAGTDLAFTTVCVSDNVPVGMTRYLRIDRANDAVEVGGTWLYRELWRSPFNTESKYLLFRHAFEEEGVHRVSLQTDVRNTRSRNAIARLGAVEEATLRDDKLLANGTYRSSVFFSVVRGEWPRVKKGLEEKLARPWDPRSAAPDTGALGSRS
jgi:N-acetyltransferase